MSKVTSKLQVTVPKALADRFGIRPGDDIRFEGSGEVIVVVPANSRSGRGALDTERRLRLFDAATMRQRARQAGKTPEKLDARSWTREELYRRGRSLAD